jgi:Zinc carboxypeptidase
MTTRRRARSTEESTSSSDDSEDDLESTAESLEDRNTTRRQHRIIFLSIVVTVTVIVLASTSNVRKSYWHPTFRITVASSTKRQRFQEQRQKEIIRPYQLWTSEDIYERLHEWTEQFPRLVELTSAQEAYNLPGAGTDADCPFEEDAPGCKTWILTIKDKSQPADEQRHSMPQVLLSGALHGDEVVGPTTVMETANLLLEAARCEALPQGHAWNGTDYIELTKEQIQRELDAARECRVNLAQRGIFPLHRKWLARLVTTRTIIVVPTANALGYFRRTREEVDIDPNRDFPFDRKDDKDCLQSIAGRSLYQLFIQRIVQMTITFHGGMEAVAYEWGAPSRTGVAPDAVSQEQISNLYSRFAGALDGGENYPTGTMNELVYPVEGGLEDWSYAASWDKELVQTLCTPTKNGGYDASLQPPTNSYSLRMFSKFYDGITGGVERSFFYVLTLFILSCVGGNK